MLDARRINCAFAGLEVGDASTPNAIRPQIAQQDKNARAGIRQWDVITCPSLAPRHKTRVAATKIA